ncbi:hypothetical protein D4T97_005100 [Siminovitchia acidinfaciens]|uniref:Uncharacterized protein n=1 Tax=Siminovitchia acidinfaciens TaxID=2321395 RepID=A0A429Y416_9BACI|nr:TnsD family Tn7-like transposition protein [Siminovitchia acidinfaciens]RST76162.1 hypothetical protein D4T97_005100 [Siminovitchia acidinfaciens]
MIPFFPMPYPDENFHSIVARYHMYSGNLAASHTYEDLFGIKLRGLKIEFPTHINTLVNRISKQSLTVDNLINNHTLYSFYTIFEGLKSRTLAREYMEKGNKKELSLIGGINKGHIKTNLTFKHCYHCIEDDIENYGETYWHRVHQIPGVLVCPSHNVPLISVRKNVMNNIDKNLILANDKKIYELNPLHTLVKRNIQQLSKYAIEAAKCLKYYSELNKIPDFPSCYKKGLQINGFKLGISYVDRQKWYSQFRRFYGDSFLNVMESELINGNQNWLFKLLNKKLFSHPLRHLLLIIFLFGTIEDLIKFSKDNKEANTEKVFGQGPWPCLNPAHIDYKKNVISDLKINVKKDRLIGVFKCTCGFVYSRNSIDLKNGLDKITKHSFGPVWEDKFRELLQRGSKTGEIGKLLQIAPSTVRKYKEIMESNNSSKRVENLKKLQIENRRLWLELLQKENVSATTNYKLYEWLLRNDREWLTKHPLPSKNNRGYGKKINWAEKDKEILTEIKNIVNNWHLIEESGFVRKTKSSIAKQTKASFETVIRGNYDNIPNTIKYIDSVVESSYEYNLRKIETAYNYLLDRNEYITTQKLHTSSGSSKYEFTKNFLSDFLSDKEELIKRKK